jgi:UDP-2,4-diacetamido-2,4,6-trideoxy-beta-L-altropyranose hydrolase/UDP-4-amino-4,6-dideoxy-N-acetyl-beta-L-altrosamine N-acetyltransferase
MNILFRVDSSSLIGTGHIMRDIVLAKQFKDDNIIFASQELEGNINFRIKESSYQLEILESNKIDEVIELIKRYDIHRIVIDNYSIDYDYEKKLKEETNIEIFVFDDTYEKHYCDILLNHNIYADELKYKTLVPESCELRCGSNYMLLRDEFINIDRTKKNNTRKTFFIAMGGSDPLNLNIEILKVLSSFKNIKVNIVTTQSNQNLEELKSFSIKQDWVNLYINCDFMAELMVNSDYAIMTPSVTSNEVYYMKLPFIAIKVAENQNYMYEYLLKNKHHVLPEFNKDTLIDILKKYFLYECELISFIELAPEEKQMILTWRNDSNIREWMYNKDIIPLESHLSYIESLKDSKDKKYFLVKKNNEYIGVIDFVKINEESAHMGIYANPKSKGVGKILLENISKYAFEELKVQKVFAEVFSENQRAYELYKKFNFKPFDKKIINDKEVICLELKYEDR